MNHGRRSLLILGLAGLVAACRRPIVTPAELRALRALDVNAAEADARKAVAAGDWRLLSVGGIAITLPGTDLAGGGFDTKRERFLAGTGDMVLDAEHSALNSRARDYAERYNREMLRIGGYTAAEQAAIRQYRLSRPDGDAK